MRHVTTQTICSNEFFFFFPFSFPVNSTSIVSVLVGRRHEVRGSFGFSENIVVVCLYHSPLQGSYRHNAKETLSVKQALDEHPIIKETAWVESRPEHSTLLFFVVSSTSSEFSEIDVHSFEVIRWFYLT